MNRILPCGCEVVPLPTGTLPGDRYLLLRLADNELIMLCEKHAAKIVSDIDGSLAGQRATGGCVLYRRELA